MPFQAVWELFRPTPVLGHEVKRCNRLRVAVSIAMVPILLAVALLSAPVEGSGTAMRAFGTLVLAAGVGLRLWALCAIDGRKKRELVTWGPYRRVRHPLYLGSLLVVQAFCILAGSWSATVLAAVTFAAVYVPAVRAEERLLAHQFGATWQRYVGRTGAFLPRFGRFGEGARMPLRLSHPWREVGVLALLFLGVLGASSLIWELRAHFAFAGWFL